MYNDPIYYGNGGTAVTAGSTRIAVGGTGGSSTSVQEVVPNSARIQELWATIKTALAGKVDTTTLERDYPTTTAMATAIATALADYAKDTEVQTAITTALADYLTATEVEQKIAEAVQDMSGGGVTMKVVESLPATGVQKIIYLVPAATPGNRNVKEEYVWILNDVTDESAGGKWEMIGSTAVDLSDYWPRSELRTMTKAELEAIMV